MCEVDNCFALKFFNSSGISNFTTVMNLNPNPNHYPERIEIQIYAPTILSLTK